MAVCVCAQPVALSKHRSALTYCDKCNGRESKQYARGKLKDRMEGRRGGVGKKRSACLSDGRQQAEGREQIFRDGEEKKKKKNKLGRKEK